MEVVEKKIRLHRIQSEFCRSNAIYRGFIGGRGAGKSHVGALDLIRRAKRGRTYMIASPTSQMMSDTTFPTLKKIAEDLGVWNPSTVKMTPYPTAILTTGSTLRFRTADNPDSMRGPNLSGIWLDEGSQMHEDAYKICIACLREGEQGWLTVTATPNGMNHWTYERFGTQQPNTELFHCPTKNNPFLPPDFADTLSKQYVGAWALQELGGLFVSMEGAEFPSEFFDGILFDDWPSDVDSYLKVMSLDPSKGKADASGDFSSWIMNAIDRESMVLWVDADMDARRPVEPLASAPGMASIVTDGIELFKRFKPCAVLVEVNGFQSMVADALLRHSTARGVPMPIYTVNHTEPKPQRIRSLMPFLAQKRLRIKNTPGGRLLLAQMRDFRGDQKKSAGIHDDGPDALASSVEMANMVMFGGDDNRVQVLRA